jgi:hypothetical protein
MPKSYSRPSSAVITIPDPDGMPFSTHVEQGGTLQWRTDTHNYPDFVIEFQGANPFDEVPNQKFSGSDEKPVVLRLNTVGNNYRYKVQHIKKDGTSKDTGPVEFSVIHCPLCPPYAPAGN